MTSQCNICVTNANCSASTAVRMATTQQDINRSELCRARMWHSQEGFIAHLPALVLASMVRHECVPSLQRWETIHGQHFAAQLDPALECATNAILHAEDPMLRVPDSKNTLPFESLSSATLKPSFEYVLRGRPSNCAQTRASNARQKLPASLPL